MESNRFDRLASSLTNTESRREVLRVLAAVTIGAGNLSVLRQDDAAARRRRHNKHKRGQAGPTRSLRQICTPGTDTCSDGLGCDTPTTRHTCSSTVEGVNTWCCVPPNAVCSGECDCCSNHYCSFENGSTGFCIPNPEE